MARIRTIKPEFYSDPELGRMSLEARYLYKGMWSFADDEGRIPGDPRFLVSQVFPYDTQISVRKMRGFIDELAAAGKVLPYTVDGLDYLFLQNFRKHQRINRPQPPKYPPPPGHVDAVARPHRGDDSVNDSVNGHKRRIPDTTHRRGDTTTTSGGGEDSSNDNGENPVIGRVRSALQDRFDVAELNLALDALEVRITAGEPPTSPVAWAQSIATRAAMARETARRTASEVKTITLDDGTQMELVDGQWREAVTS